MLGHVGDYIYVADTSTEYGHVSHSNIYVADTCTEYGHDSHSTHTQHIFGWSWTYYGYIRQSIYNQLLGYPGHILQIVQPIHIHYNYLADTGHITDISANPTYNTSTWLIQAILQIQPRQIEGYLLLTNHYGLGIVRYGYFNEYIILLY